MPTLVGLQSDKVTNWNLNPGALLSSRVLIATPGLILLTKGDAVELGNGSGSQVGDRGSPLLPRVGSITALKPDPQQVHWRLLGPEWLRAVNVQPC